MPSSTRRARERAGIRDRIIEAALHVLESEGAGALTVRRIATDVEYTAPVVYQHFAGKDALVAELVVHGYALLMADAARIAAGEPDVDRRLLRVAAGYVRFASEHPHLYEVMNGTTIAASNRRDAAQPTIDLLTELLAAWSAEHGVTPPGDNEACEIIWGVLHGLASLGYHDTVGNERAQRLAEQALATILRGWQATAR
ncbi:TetR/AcrR family transcriptional regulator [Actinoplanes couchii]|uniref:TetR family transcriptional regulator n=1 Tax=Actinoplanes couchii TaxID=403638 RepID=A0ABQ3XU59_9ACTN|nr:TetR/AcrR family transcriptional regulator [Actinoplanes couchii]MDR6317752.1 AcrR family transcriptional regulator [Actinoplanes couchii]GID62000.1 TetR family transcriptional regulator [Actinoplanes couchii]